MKHLLACFTASALAIALPATGTATIRTNDGFALDLGDDGRPAAIQLDGRELPLVLWLKLDAEQASAIELRE